jgi:hypothetical protein
MAGIERPAVFVLPFVAICDGPPWRQADCGDRSAVKAIHMGHRYLCPALREINSPENIVRKVKFDVHSSAVVHSI